VTVRARVEGHPLLFPLARVLVERGDELRVRLIMWGPELGPLSTRTNHLDSRSALALARAAGHPTANKAELVVLPGRPNSRLGWLVDVPLDFSGPTRPLLIVDDESGRVRTLLDRVRDSEVRAWEFNPLQTPDPELFELLEIDEPQEFLTGPRVRAQNCVAPQSGNGICSKGQVATADGNGDFIYPAPDPFDPADSAAGGELISEAIGYYHSDKLLGWLDGQGFAGMTCVPLDIVVNYTPYTDGEPTGFQNAFFTG
jgi:hypothetical protein